MPLNTGLGVPTAFLSLSKLLAYLNLNFILQPIISNVKSEAQDIAL